MILNDFFKAVAQLNDSAFKRVLFLGLGLTIALLIGIYAGWLWLIETFADGPLTLPFVGEITWIGNLAGWGGLALILLMSVFLMIPVASAITSFFLEDVADAVEAKHYPLLMPAPKVPFVDAVRDTIMFFGVLIGANLLAFVAYAIMPFFAVPIFFALNGYLLGREYFTIAAMRREGRAGARAMYRQNTAEIWMAGLLMAVPLTIPLLNLFVPILGAATFTHLYHRISARSGAIGSR
ncbi:EI24 domain-containing protein [Octadecabacter sp. CECT 8868]|uniref:EI24 domain-containing protein n=1 Tax=Octadecabacter algicola TaxID=2909342 RepID=UPI001F2051C1|nr:EI24 domain-containing protein [Octadecabacter algicola]MCF2905250.1 EI24 domain-containing protein [Octadecabacter algicola]